MKTFIIFTILVLFLVAVQYSRGKSVDDIIDDHLNARGGLQPLRDIQTLLAQGILKVGEQQSKILLIQSEQLLSLQIRNDFDEGSNWRITPQSAAIQSTAGNWTNIPAHLQPYLAGWLQVGGSLAGYAGKGFKASWHGTPTLDGMLCYKVHLQHGSGLQYQFWISKERLLLEQCIVQFPSPNHSAREEILVVDGWLPADIQQITIRYNGYMAAEQLLFPHSMAIKVQGAHQEMLGVLTWKLLQLNAGEA